MKTFRVATFVHQRGEGRRPLYNAYTRWFNESWNGCAVFDVEAVDGKEAKKKAIELRKAVEQSK